MEWLTCRIGDGDDGTSDSPSKRSKPNPSLLLARTADGCAQDKQNDTDNVGAAAVASLTADADALDLDEPGAAEALSQDKQTKLAGAPKLRCLIEAMLLMGFCGAMHSKGAGGMSRHVPRFSSRATHLQRTFAGWEKADRVGKRSNKAARNASAANPQLERRQSKQEVIESVAKHFGVAATRTTSFTSEIDVLNDLSAEYEEAGLGGNAETDKKYSIAEPEEPKQDAAVQAVEPSTVDDSATESDGNAAVAGKGKAVASSDADTLPPVKSAEEEAEGT